MTDTLHCQEDTEETDLDSRDMVASKDSKRNDCSSTIPQLELNERQCSDNLKQSPSANAHSSNGPFVMPVLPVPSADEVSSKTSVVLTGTAGKGGLGPAIGAVDIGISNCAYFFRISLPGVRKDPGKFSCEIERDGKVCVRGETTTGGSTVSRSSRVFKMKFRQQPPPGPFTLFFTLPGPVDPRLCIPNFRSDGIFEAVVLKQG